MSPNLLPRLLLQTAAFLIVIALLLLLPAADLAWPQAWIFIAEIAVTSLAVSLWLFRHDKALLEARLSGPVQRDQRPWDRLFMAAVGVFLIAWLLLCALDHSHRWSATPPWLETLGAILIALAMVATWLTFRVNTFAAPQVRTQPGRDHHVVTAGPYRIVRHPMYAGALLFFAGTPLLLGTLWGLLGLPLFALAFAVRALGEERMLRHELPGYDAYAARVRYRLIPFLW